MRFPIALLVVFGFGLSACANMSPGLRPNGWARPAGEEAGVAGREAAPPVRVASAGRSIDPRREESTPSDRPPLSASGLVIPVAGVASAELRDSFTAPRSGGRTHNAIDISAPTGTPVLAVTTGTISRKHWNGLGGRTLYLTSDDGRYDFYYAHLDSYAEGIEIGSQVRKGEIIGTVGSTGNAQGPHLHFQVLDKYGSGRGTPVNPFDLLRNADLANSR